jgi:MFS family permease
MPLVISMFGFSIFNISVAVGKDLQTVLICRFWAGFFGACPLAVVAAVFTDIFDNRTRGIAITLFSMMVFTGPLLAPFIGGFITESYLGWRWTEYLTLPRIRPQPLLSQGVVPARNPRRKGGRAAPPHPQLGHPRQAGGNRGRHARAHPEELFASAAHAALRAHRAARLPLRGLHLRVGCSVPQSPSKTNRRI